MPVSTNNKYLRNLLETLVTSYETEINYTPTKIRIDPEKIKPQDIATLMAFVTETRKRLFIFKIAGDKHNSSILALTANRAILNQTAKTILQSTSTEPRINPLKQALSTPSSSVRAGIQIQKSYALPRLQNKNKDEQIDIIDQAPLPDITLIPLELCELPILENQLRVLGIQALHDVAARKIKKHAHAFTDGIIPDNLPRGFYIDQEKYALCYTKNPPRLPSALTPALKKLKQIALPTSEQIGILLPAILPENIYKLLNTDNLIEQQSALITTLPAHRKEMTAFLQSVESNYLTFLIPLLTKLFVHGGESHACLFSRLIKACLAKKINIDFLRNPLAQDAFLSARGIKNLQKLIRLPGEQRNWWNTLTSSHLENKDHYFDFNTFFEAYTQIFLPRIAEKNLTLPYPCPVKHKGHLLITLNRVLDVIENAVNPQEQCLALAGLNWGPTGVHYAMISAPENERMQQVAACMLLENPDDSNTNPELILNQLDDASANLLPWIYRYMGQHWKSDIRLTDINAQLKKINKIDAWTAGEKKQLTFLVTTMFSHKAPLTVASWKHSLKIIINHLKPLESADRYVLLQATSRSFKFAPPPSPEQIQVLIEQLLALKQAFPAKHFKDELITPLISCLEKEGFDLLNTLQERIEKTQGEVIDLRFSLTAQFSFTNMLQQYRELLTPDMIKMLASINEPALSNSQINNLILAMTNLSNKKGHAFTLALSGILGQINISKSQILPNLQHIISLINTLADSPLPIEMLTKDYILEQNFLPGCVLGKGDISKLDDLIVDALVDAVKKRSAVLKIDALKDTLIGHLGHSLVPKQLRDQLDRELMPLLDALAELIALLQSPNPSFENVIAQLRIFEEKKPLLLDGVYSLRLVGQSTGEYLLSFILTGKRKEGDKLTDDLFASLLGKLHNQIVDSLNSYFDNADNKAKVKDLDAKTVLSWWATFNNTHSISFLFKEELLEKKVLPALRKTLLLLNTQDPAFEKSILDAASNLTDDKPADITLTEYKEKIEAIANYLNLLIDIKDQKPVQFNAIYKQLQTGPLARINYKQKQIFINKLLTANPAALPLYLKLSCNALDDNPDANEQAIERAINGLVVLFDLSDLEPDTQTMFFKMSMAHNLRYPSPFPLVALNELKKSGLAEQTKTIILKQIIQILSRMRDTDSPELIQGLVQQTHFFLTNNPEHTQLCIALLKHISTDNLGRDLNAYQNILMELAANEQIKNNMATILTGFATRKKDETVNLPTLLAITKGFVRRPAADVERVLKLFKTPPFPIAQMINLALMDHDSEKLKSYCQNFDTNPFTKPGETRPLAKQFATDRIQDALSSLQDLMNGVSLPHSLQLQLARQLTYIETLGYTDPLIPNDFAKLQKLTASSRHDLQNRAVNLLVQMRNNAIPAEQLEVNQLELLAYLREIYFRTTGLFPNTTQMLMLLLSLHTPKTNLLMSIKTGEGKSLITPMLAVLQWAQGGTVDVCTANRTLLRRDYENNCEPFFTFLGIQSAVIQADNKPKDYQPGGINCSTLEDMSLFRLAAKEAGQDALVQNDAPIHLVLDECDDALLDQTTLYKLVAEHNENEAPESNSAQWIYPLARQFVNLPAFRNTSSSQGAIWDEEEDLEQFRLFLNKEISDKYQGDASKQNILMASTNTQLRQWMHASCKAAKLIENKHFIVQPIYEKDESGNEINKKMVCVPLFKSTPKGGCIFTDGVQQALQARLLAERGEQGRNFSIDADPPVLASQSACGLIQFYRHSRGRLVGISGTPGDTVELDYLNTILGTQAVGVAPFAGDIRKKHPPTFTTSDKDTISAIHRAIDSIKLPITEPTMMINRIPPQTYEECEAILIRHNQSIDTWSQTQTQPILLICEDFDEAEKIERSLEAYQKAGFKIQTVTGKESPEELERIIRHAGCANTITIGTAMLARGIDINPGNHPQGLFVIQAYTDSERINTQIAGRAARNGKPGQWTPIYQIQPPKGLLTQILCYLFPSYRQQKSQEAVTKLQADIKLQDSVDRLYTQAIDKAQQSLILQIKSWETLLLELYPSDPKIQFELYQWREMLLSELTHYQESNVSHSNLESSIIQFNSSISKLWETVREEKWVVKAQKASSITPEQTLRLNYLKQCDLTQECNIQAELQQKSASFKAGTMALMHQNTDMMILDKAGAVLSYTNPDSETRKALVLAQSKQLLPNLIAEFCSLYPRRIKSLVPKKSAHDTAFLPGALNSLIETTIMKKNQGLDKEQITEPLINLYQQALVKADSNDICELLTKLHPSILSHSKNVARMPLIEQFKMRGMIITYCNLYKDSGLPRCSRLSVLKTNFDQAIMKKLANYLIDELSWVNESPSPFHALLEREVACDAALALYTLAKKVQNSPQDEQKIQALYQALQKQRLVLQDKYLFSIGHTSVRDVITVALSAIDTLNEAPYCSKGFQQRCHDDVLSQHHLAEFDARLQELSTSYNEDGKIDPLWTHLQHTLETIRNRAVKNQTHLIEELYQAVKRFSSYNNYRPYHSSIEKLKTQLAESLAALKKPDGLKQDSETSLLEAKVSQFADIFHIAPDNIRIQNGSDGIRPYIELQIRDSSFQEGFTGYQSPCVNSLAHEKKQLALLKSNLLNNKQALIDLKDEKISQTLSPARQAEFKKLLDIKALPGNWGTNFNNPLIAALPMNIQSDIGKIRTLNTWDWTINPVDLEAYRKLRGKEPKPAFIRTIEIQTTSQDELTQAGAQKILTEQLILDLQKNILLEENKLRVATELSKDAGTGFLAKIPLKLEIHSLEKTITDLKTQLTKARESLAQQLIREKTYRDDLSGINKNLDAARTKLIHSLISRATNRLNKYLPQASTNLFDAIQSDLTSAEQTLEKLIATEMEKARYQTRRFSNTRELLNYEACLTKEKANVVKKIVSSKASESGFFSKSVSETMSMPSLFGSEFAPT